MKYNFDDVLYCVYSGEKIGKVLDALPTGRGMYTDPQYKFASKTTKSGYSWCSEWLLTNRYMGK